MNNSLDDIIGQLRRDKDDLRKGYDQMHKEVTRLQAVEAQLKRDIQNITDIATKHLLALHSKYQAFYKETIHTVRQHPGGKCKDCDMKALLEKIRELGPKFIEP